MKTPANEHLWRMYTPVEMDWVDITDQGLTMVLRQTVNLKKGRAHAHGFKGLGFDEHWMGCVSENAVARWRNVYWDSLKLGVVDCHDVQVRAVLEIGRRLILHPEDPDDQPYISVLIDLSALPTVFLRGWIMGRDGKRQEFWCDPEGKKRHAFFVPNKLLRPMSTLPPVILREAAE